MKSAPGLCTQPRGHRPHAQGPLGIQDLEVGEDQPSTQTSWV